MAKVEFYRDKTGREPIWELRPLKDRIFFFYCFYCGSGSAYILLHHFLKKTRKTPEKELARARVNLLELEGRE